MRNLLMTTFATVGLLSSALSALAGDELAAIKKQLNSNILQENTAAVRTLGAIGPAAAETVPSLLTFLDAEDAGLRYESIIALGRINSNAEQVIPALIGVLSDKLALLQYAAIDAMRRFGPQAKEALPQLKHFLRSESPHIRISAARAIVEIGLDQGLDISPAASVLIAGLKSSRSDLAADALHGLAFIGVPAVPAIQELVNNPDPQIASNACDTLAAIGPDAAEAAPLLAEVVTSGKPAIRSHAINALGEIGSAANAWIPVLITALKDSDVQVRFNAEQALHKLGKSALPALVEGLNDVQLQPLVTPIIGTMGDSASAAIKPLSRLLTSTDPVVRREAIFALAAIGPDAQSTVPGLIKSLNDPRFAHRGAAAYALGRIGGKPAEDALKVSVNEKNAVVRLASACALIEIEPDSVETANFALPVLSTALKNERREIRREAARASGRLGVRAKKIVPELQQGLNDQDRSVRRECLNSLANIGPASRPAVDEIIKNLDQHNAELRSIACYALGRIGNASAPAIPRLQQMLENGTPHDKTVAAWALVHIAPSPETRKATIPVFAAALHGNDNPQVRLQVAETLGEIGQDSPLAKDALEVALKDSAEVVRKAAEKALISLK